MRFRICQSHFRVNHNDKSPMIPINRFATRKIHHSFCEGRAPKNVVQKSLIGTTVLSLQRRILIQIVKKRVSRFCVYQDSRFCFKTETMFCERVPVLLQQRDLSVRVRNVNNILSFGLFISF